MTYNTYIGLILAKDRRIKNIFKNNQS